jgi:hypothetical protein
MPKMSGSGWTGIPWVFCNCHQWQWPSSLLSRQDGLIVCPLGRDNPQRTRVIDRRQNIIRNVLTDGKEEPALAPILTETQDNTTDD